MLISPADSGARTGRTANRRLGAGLLLSLIVHALVLSIQFGVPGPAPGGTAPLTVSLNMAAQPHSPVAPAPVLPPAQFVPAPLPPMPAVPTAGFRLVDPAPVPKAAPAPAPKPSRKPARRSSPALPQGAPGRLRQRVIARLDKADPAFSVPLPPSDEGGEGANRHVDSSGHALPAAAPEAPPAEHVERQDEEVRAALEIERQRRDAADQEARLAQERAEAEQAEKRAQQLAAEEEASRLARQRAAGDEALRLAQQQAAEEAALRLAQQQAEQERARQEQEALAALARQRQAELDQARLLAQQREEQLRHARELAERQRAEEEAHRLAMLERERQENDARQAQQLALRRQAEEEAARREAAALAAQRQAEELHQQRMAEQQAQRRRAEALAQQQEERRRAEALAQQQAEQAARKRLEDAAHRAAELAAGQQRARQPLAHQDGGMGAAPVSTPGDGRGVQAGGMRGSDFASRARELLRGIQVPGPVPAAALSAEDEQLARRRALAWGAERDVPLRMYVDSFRQKIERNATLGRSQPGEPVVSVAIRSDGSIEDVTIVRSSGRPDTDEAVRRIVRLNARYSAFPPNVAARFDVIEIRRIWSFAQGLKLLEELR